METKKKEQNTKAEAETFAATVKGMNRDDQLISSAPGLKQDGQFSLMRWASNGSTSRKESF